MTDILTKTLDKYYSGKWDSFASPTGTMADFEKINWVGDAPNKSDFQAHYDAEELAYNNAQYQRNRSTEYPTWQEQMDMQYHDAKNGTNTWQKAIEAVKTKYPKGE